VRDVAAAAREENTGVHIQDYCVSPEGANRRKLVSKGSQKALGESSSGVVPSRLM